MITLEGVTKRYGDLLALDEATFTVQPGRLTGFVGANGAGKTTAMRILMGVLRADAGQVLLDGQVLDAATRRRFGYMPEERGLYPKMRVAEQLAYLATLHGFDRASADARVHALLEHLDLAERARDPVESLSLGNQQRAQVAAALVHDPSVLVLDEPFSGLDPIAVDMVAQVLTEHAARGVPVLFSSHQLDLVERLCDDLVIIAGGTIRACGAREELRERHGASRYALVAASTGWLHDEPGVEVVETDDDRSVFAADADTAQHVLRTAVERGPVHQFGPVVPSLAEIFREVMTDAQVTR
ncbi:MAG: ATP-binding cassette domain-containing protein [Micrococcales bacterium]|nr:ATP-binding cassette domain-containing protein [Micrococcales bacterium]MCL2666341.1 ATP-binding cassette domain-containing protein [Micrococcales bacterium]